MKEFNKCLVCGGRITNAKEWTVEGAIDIRSYPTNDGKKTYNVTIEMKDGFIEGEIDRSLRKALKRIANKFVK